MANSPKARKRSGLRKKSAKAEVGTQGVALTTKELTATADKPQLTALNVATTRRVELSMPTGEGSTRGRVFRRRPGPDEMVETGVTVRRGAPHILPSLKAGAHYFQINAGLGDDKFTLTAKNLENGHECAREELEGERPGLVFNFEVC
ncbi:hypothetical protein D7Y15_13125 [Corallococcus sp. AB030]|uniref:hypothetical protein n=1 Tax=Corallococcus sp. AB030 TaxID=2316716 RepID=UPI000EBFBE29|nr:hypothetical protein [Corallococcus sp. AB030]RKI15745.1 hypothetical protein D7Y15_13125 [Corallococcus sp. AB030]